MGFSKNENILKAVAAVGRMKEHGPQEQETVCDLAEGGSSVELCGAARNRGASHCV